ncbi:MAG TPA: signal recognition particle-docking protein FtsY [Actinobacteria bacterium]|jgi:fused signal recognition particle receptor|nr:signal recognition particle-docking protein FtsY [Actinomycetota bacterium]HCP61951.1 signal recognition particle-docking protein FtsY [Actinomycetota bacterium]
MQRRRTPLRRPSAFTGPVTETTPSDVVERGADRERAAAAIPVAGGLGSRIRALFGGGVTEETWAELQDALVRADVGPKAASAIVQRVRSTYKPPMDPAQVVAEEIAGLFAGDEPWKVPTGSPGVVMVVGVNGTGKTTTIGKLAHRLAKEGHTVSLAASDTFRAAAGEQLETWAERTGAHLVQQGRGADPGAVAFDALKAAQARGSDVLIVDTAGRLHTRTPLMAELTKVKRVLEKAGRPADEVLLVLDATTGQNGIQQARAFTDAVGVTGVVLSKMDGTARGGIVIAVREELGVPVKLVGIGEGIDDLVPFDPAEFARGLVA